MNKQQLINAGRQVDLARLPLWSATKRPEMAKKISKKSLTSGKVCKGSELNLKLVKLILKYGLRHVRYVCNGYLTEEMYEM